MCKVNLVRGYFRQVKFATFIMKQELMITTKSENVETEVRKKEKILVTISYFKFENIFIFFVIYIDMVVSRNNLQ